MSFSVSTTLAPEVILSRATDHLFAVGYDTDTDATHVHAFDGREYTLWIAICLFIFFFIPFLIYWFTRPKNMVEVTATSGGCTIAYQGRKALSDANALADILRNSTTESMSKPEPDQRPAFPTSMYCRKCGAKIPADSTFCQKCGVKLVEE